MESSATPLGKYTLRKKIDSDGLIHYFNATSNSDGNLVRVKLYYKDRDQTNH